MMPFLWGWCVAQRLAWFRRLVLFASLPFLHFLPCLSAQLEKRHEVLPERRSCRGHVKSSASVPSSGHALHHTQATHTGAQDVRGQAFSPFRVCPWSSKGVLLRSPSNRFIADSSSNGPCSPLPHNQPITIPTPPQAHGRHHHPRPSVDMSSCSVCYEDYAWPAAAGACNAGNAPQQQQQLFPRTLPCGCVACTGCLQDACDTDDSGGTLVCPSCCASHALAGSVAEVLPVLPPEEEEEALPNPPPTSSSSSSASSSSKRRESSSSSSLAAFLHRNPSSSALACTPIITHCAKPGCMQQRTEEGGGGGGGGSGWYCPVHTLVLADGNARASQFQVHRYVKSRKLARLCLRQEGDRGGGNEEVRYGSRKVR